MRRKNYGTTRYHSDAQEKRLAKQFGGIKTPMSGAGSIKGDVQTEEFFIEAKTTSKTQYTLKLADLETLTRQATTEGKLPLFVIDLANEARGAHRSWVAMPLSELEALLDRRLT